MSQVVIGDILPYTQSTATAGQTVFGTNWTANYSTDVVVFYTPSGSPANDATQQLMTSQFSVAFIGGSQQVQVTLVTPANLGDTITITRETPADRENLYSNTNFTPSMLNNDFGILTLVDQQAQLVNQLIGPRYNYSAIITDVVDTILPILGASQLWAKNAGNTAIVAVTLGSASQAAATNPAYPYLASTDGGFTPGHYVTTNDTLGTIVDGGYVPGTVTQVGSGTGLTGGPITSSGTLSFAPIAANSFWANMTGGTAVPSVHSLGSFLLSANNLSDVASISASVANLGLTIGTNTQAHSVILDEIAAGTWTGATSITTLGTITTGTWHGTTIAVPNGGTGNTTFTPYTVLCAGITPTGAFQNVTNTGVLGSVLTSNGPGALPSWISGSSSVTPATIQNHQFTFSQDTGTANNYVATVTPAPLAINAGFAIELLVANTNTGAATVAVNSFGPNSITDISHNALVGGEMIAGMIAQLYFDGTRFQLLNPVITVAVFPAALTRTNDTNVTVTLGGTPNTALLQAVSLTLGWTGTLSAPRGGLGLASPTAHGILVGEGASAVNPIVLGAGQILIGTTAGDPTAAAINSGTGILVGNASGSITVSLAPIATLNILSNITGGSAVPIANTLTATIDAAIGSTQGDILYRNGTVWTVLAPGTSGQFLTTGGAAANPSWTSQVAPTGQALTEVDDTNVTMTLGGSPTTALLAATSMTLGWTGQLAVGRGGTGLAALTAHNLIIGNGTSAGTLLAPSATSGVPLISQGASSDPAYGTAVVAGGGTGLTSATAYAVLCGGTSSTGAFQSIAAVGSSGQVLTSNGAGALPTFQNATGTGTVNSGLINQLAYYAAAGSVVSGLTTANNGVLVTSAGGVPSISTTLPSGLAATNMALTTPSLGAATATSLTFSPTTSGIVGTTTNDNATAGKVGEIVFSQVLSGAPVSITSATSKDITSIALTAGDWDFWGNGFIINGSSTGGFIWISLVSATLPDESMFGVCPPSVLLTGTGAVAPGGRLSLSGAATLYLSCNITFTSTATACGQLWARRRR